MTDLNYNINRQEASDILEVSTRTLDRYIKSWKLTYKKSANKVMLSSVEVESFKEKINFVWKEVQDSELIWNFSHSTESWSEFDEDFNKEQFKIELKEDINSALKNSLDVLNSYLKEKDNQIEDKNNLIINLQTKVVNLESRLQNSIALPDYTNEKESLLIEKEKVELQNKTLLTQLKSHKIKSTWLLISVIILIIFFIFYIFILGR